jgi:hypothetical protein
VQTLAIALDKICFYLQQVACHAKQKQAQVAGPAGTVSSSTSTNSTSTSAERTSSYSGSGQGLSCGPSSPSPSPPFSFPSPLRMLNEQETIHELWSGPQSIARRALAAVCEHEDESNVHVQSMRKNLLPCSDQGNQGGLSVTTITEAHNALRLMKVRYGAPARQVDTCACNTLRVRLPAWCCTLAQAGGRVCRCICVCVIFLNP